jgi:hypothetical protein
MANFAAGTTILGFVWPCCLHSAVQRSLTAVVQIPTILSMVGTSRDDHLRIHKRFPFLALLLSACNPSTIIVGLVWRTDIPPDDVFLKSRIQIDGYKHITVVLHGAAMAAAGLAIWQAVILGMRGVVAFACPTWYNPLIWVLVGPVGHIIDVVFIRWCIEGRRHRWRWNLSAVDGLKIRRPWVMRSKDMILTVRRVPPTTQYTDSGDLLGTCAG